VIPSPDFGRLAADYDRVRPVDENWQEVFRLVVAEADLRGRRVLDCGCGTGRLARALAESALAKVWGVDPEPRMLDVARSRLPESIGLKEGRAEELPFRDGWFDRAVLWLVCHLIDREAAFPELRRVLTPGGRLAVVTFDPVHFDRFWLNELFPSLEPIDRARFPTQGRLETELAAAGFAGVRFARLSQRATLARDEALERIRSRHISTFDLLDPDEVRAGTERAMEELPATVEYALEWLIAVAER
jgi:SAM-dependent methyltransferase